MSNRTPTYSARTVQRARELRAAGWGYVRIAELIAKETGESPSHPTIWRWLNPTKARAEARRAMVARRSSRPVQPRAVTKEVAVKRMRLLRERGLDPTSIAIVAEVWWGEKVCEATVRYRCQEKAA